MRRAVTIAHENHIALVTSTNTDLGFEAAAQLAERSYGQVILACRTNEKVETARRQLVERVGKDVFDILAIDVLTSTLASALPRPSLGKDPYQLARAECWPKLTDH